MNQAGLLVVSPLVLSELDNLVTSRHGSRIGARLLTGLIEPEFEMASFTASDLSAAIDLMRTYEDMSLDLTDASLVVLAKRYKTNEILTLDPGRFRAVRGLDGRYFKLLPFDAD